MKAKKNAVVLTSVIICGMVASDCTGALNNSSGTIEDSFSKYAKLIKSNKITASFLVAAGSGIASFVFIKKALVNSKSLTKENSNVGNITGEDTEEQNVVKRIWLFSGSVAIFLLTSVFGVAAFAYTKKDSERSKGLKQEDVNEGNSNTENTKGGNAKKQDIINSVKKVDSFDKIGVAVVVMLIVIFGIAAFVFIKKAFGKSKDLKEDENIGNIINENAEKLENEIKRVKRTELFEAVTGVSEEKFRDDKEIMKKCIKKDKNGNFYIVNQKTKGETCAGNFEQISIGEMDKLLKNKKLPGNGGTFNVISLKGDYSGYSEDLKKKVDISALQANEENQGKVFVLASNYNALETTDKTDSVSKKTIKKVCEDLTQGPFGSLSGMAALILRTYFMFYDEKGDPKDWWQTDKKQINLLKDLGIEIQNGYVKTDDGKELYDMLNKEGAKEKYKIGYHKNVQISGGYFNNNNQEFIRDKDQKVDQIFLAALDVNINRFKGDTQEYAEKAAKLLLKWNYEAILKSAFLNGKKEVIIPLLGCGVFCNKPEWHIEAINENLDFIKESGMKVILNLFSEAMAEVFSEKWNEVVEALKDIAKDTKGNYVVYA